MDVSPHRHTTTAEVSSDEPDQDNGPLSTSVTPIYWQHRRRESYLSIGTTKPPPITLEDNTGSNSDINSPLWARAVAINDYTIVSGGVPGVGDYITWNCKIDTLDGGSIVVRKRYSDFDDLRKKLGKTFPSSKAAMPLLPPKSIWNRFQPEFLEKRRTGLAYFLNCVLLNPEFSSSPVTKDFIFD